MDLKLEALGRDEGMRGEGMRGEGMRGEGMKRERTRREKTDLWTLGEESAQEDD